MHEKVKKIIYLGLVLNIVLTILKITSGLLGDSYSLFSDGINSLSDVFISITLLLTVKYSSKEPDKDHPYGHEKYEAIINLFLGIFLIITALLLTYNTIINFNTVNNPKSFTIIIAVIAIAIKVIIYRLNIIGYKKYDQISLRADAYNHLGDILATSLSLVGIILSRNSILYAESIAAIIISIFILVNGSTVIKEAINYIVDLSPEKEFNDKIKAFILKIDGVIKIDDFKSRYHVKNIYVDVEIAVDGKLSLIESHEIAENVHLMVEKEFEEVLHCMVHVNPNRKKDKK